MSSKRRTVICKTVSSLSDRPEEQEKLRIRDYRTLVASAAETSSACFITVTDSPDRPMGGCRDRIVATPVAGDGHGQVCRGMGLVRTFGSRNRLPGGGKEASVITQEVQKAINDQINREVYAAYLYLAMSAYLDSENFSGMARWMRAQYEEELVHALKFVDFMTDKGGVVRLQAVEAPPSDFTSPLSCFEASLEHEREVTEHLANLYDLAWRQKDHAAHVLLEWFMAEQVEEEKTAEEIVAKLRLAGDNGAALLVMETELGKRNGATATATEPIASV